jgi:hypothetical protein
VPYSSKVSHKRQDLKKKKLLNMKCVFRVSSQLLSETLIILTTMQRYTINSHGSARKVPIIVLRLVSNLNFINRYSKNSQKSNCTVLRMNLNVSQLIVYMVIVCCSESHAKQNKPCGQNITYLNVKTGGTLTNHWVVSG